MKTDYLRDDAFRRAVRSPYFQNAMPLTRNARLEVSRRKHRVDINRPIQIGIAVYQLSKLRMLQFVYDFLDKFIPRKYYELLETDTDSCYFSLGGAAEVAALAEFDLGDKKQKAFAFPATRTALRSLVPVEKLAEFDAVVDTFLCSSIDEQRTPGLFKLEPSATASLASAPNAIAFALKRAKVLRQGAEQKTKPP